MMKYTVVDIPGNSKLKVATVVENDEQNKKSPEWMISIQNMCHSDIVNFESYSTLFGWQGDCGRPTSSGFGPNTNGLDHSVVTFILPVMNSLTELESALYKGRPVDPVSIIKVGTIGFVKVKLQEITFTGCHITQLQQEFDRIIVSMSICEKQNTLFQYDPQGRALGQLVSKIDFVKNVAD